jgi:hypothetical protein
MSQEDSTEMVRNDGLGLGDVNLHDNDDQQEYPGLIGDSDDS